MTPTGYVFDAYGTLFDLINPVAARAARIGDKAEALSELWRRKQLEYSWLRSLMGQHADFWQVTGEALDYAMAALGVEDLALRA
ncbi:HAD-IA family hydrolase, partial [Roseitalea porphyridii]|uniref:HAD-IA family hydrolase n=1 Tax=Roseitalea porphyridii TaxID=1852022 RepID=UPI0032EABF11